MPIIVALNKMDKANARPEYVKQALADQLSLVPDDWGGSTMVIPVSARMKTGLEDLLEAILLVADEVGVKANPKRDAVGTVLEGRGVIPEVEVPLARAQIQQGIDAPLQAAVAYIKAQSGRMSP